MKFKVFCKYLLAGSLITLPNGVGHFRDTGMSVHAQQVITPKETSVVQPRIDSKAKNLCDTYINFVLQGQKNIKSGKGGHARSVQRELPGAPAKWYCLFGLYTQLNRALNQMGDTLTLIPFTSRNACPTFRKEMRQKYSAQEYAGALHSGKMFKSDVEYNRALEAFLKHNRITDSTPEDKRNAVIAKFQKNNFKASDLHPGAIIIVQHNNISSNTHAITYLGRGRVEHGKFVPDENGAFIYAGYNNESIGDIFKVYNTKHIFAADIYNIAQVDYGKEYDKLMNMEHDDLFRFVYDMPQENCWLAPTDRQLAQLATEKYFNRNFNIPQPQVRTSMAGFSGLPGIILNIKQR